MPVVTLLFLLAASATPRPADSRGTVNLVLGDASAAAGYVPPLEGLTPVAAERARVAGHLRYVHDRLAQIDTRHLPASARRARARNLARLAHYADTGVFPRNDDHPDARRPTFIDARGRICAVGALFEADRGRAAAARIARDHKYAFITEIDDAELAAWQRTSGLTPLELAMIQPSYSPEPERIVIPFALLDRVAPGPGRLFATTEMAIEDSQQHALTLHAQHTLYRGGLAFDTAAFATLPLRLTPDPTALTRGAAIDEDAGVQAGTAEAGLYFSFHQNEEAMKILRFGILLPTGTADDGSWSDVRSARPGDAVLAMPRSAGGRMSFSTLIPANRLRDENRTIVRFDAGVDAVKILDGGIHVITRAGIGAMRVRPRVTTSIETALSWAPSSDGRPHLRWSAGVAARLTRADGFWQRFQPALIGAVVRTIDGWGATVSLDLSLTLRAARWLHPFGE